jgi:hypothetical protein
MEGAVNVVDHACFIDWQTMSNIATVLGIFVAISGTWWTWRNDRRREAVARVLAFKERFENEPFRSIRARAAKYLNGNQGGKPELDGEAAVFQVLNHFEGLAFLYRKKMADIDLIDSTFGYWIRNYLHVCKQLIDEEVAKQQGTYFDLNSLAEKLRDRWSHQISFKPEREFLVEEASQ